MELAMGYLMNSRLRRGAAALMVGAVLVASIAASPTATAAGASPKVVLDPDDNYSYVDRDGQRFTELPITHDIAQSVQAQLPTVCAADVVITRGTSPDFVSPSTRAAVMQDADVSVTLSLNSLYGVPWGFESDGGSSSFATSTPPNLAFGQDLVNQIGAFTGRPTYPVNGGPTNGTPYPPLPIWTMGFSGWARPLR